MPSLIAASATRQPILPRPMMPSVWPASSIAGERLLAVLDRACRGRPSPASSAATKRSAGGEVARRHQHAGEHQLLDRVGVGAGRVEHRHAARAHRRAPGCCWCRRRRGRSPSRWPESPCACMSAERTRIASGSATSLPTRSASAGRRFRPALRDLVEHQDLASVAAQPCVRLELLHVGDQRLHALDRHRVVDRRAHAADRAVALQLHHAARLRALEERARRAPRRAA